ncbi:tyrosine/serine/threonine protein phosphatase [Martiniozyma asiatica (nom. inval.)]|nr:tyrosine/serine/threonine protein phosphatase [Martiniozyma asiatica]
MLPLRSDAGGLTVKELDIELVSTNEDNGLNQRRSSKRTNSSSIEDVKPRSKLSFSSKMKDLRTHLLDLNYQISFNNASHVLSFEECKLVDCEVFIKLFKNFLDKELPDVEIMFPWLHGMHPNNYGQMSFLTSKNSNVDSARVISFSKPNEEEADNFNKFLETPNVRFLLPIRSSNIDGQTSSTYTSVITESTGIIRGSVSADDILLPEYGIPSLELYLTTVLPSAIFQIFSLELIIFDCKNCEVLPEFQNLDPETGINLRNFHIQVCKISHVSDFMIYCFNNDHFECINEKDKINKNNKCKCVSLARLLHIAQIVYQLQHPEIIKELKKDELLNFKKYNTFIINNPNEKILNDSDLMAIDSLPKDSSQKFQNELCSTYDLNVFHNWDSNYLYRERLEISKMSAATPIDGHVWFGNITDYECFQIKISLNESIPIINDNELNKFLLKIKKDPLYCDPKNSIVPLKRSDFKDKSKQEIDSMLIATPKTHWKFFVHCHEKAKFLTLEETKKLFENCHNLEQINIEFPVSGSLSLVDMSDEDILSIINICKLCYYKCNWEFPALFYCSDGYTETSLFGLCYLMYSQKIGVDEAILKLHYEYGRPFFIFKSDYGLLNKLELILTKMSVLNNNFETRDNFKLEENKLSIRTLLLSPKPRSRNNSVGLSNNFRSGVFGSNNTPQSLYPLQSLSSSSSSSSSSRPIPNSNTFISSTGQHVVQLRGQSQFGSCIKPGIGASSLILNRNGKHKSLVPIEGTFEQVEGSLPSRILNHLYLGSIDHANCIELLERLDITHIVSVGEKIRWVENIQYEIEVTDSGCEILTIKPGQTLNGYLLTINKIMRLNNINDDGIGTLTSTINDALKFIDDAYLNKGKVLVHCQVGVSRSATVCIAECCKRLNVSVARGYMFVRVRRLNVIIQPNLKLMYELFKWEEIDKNDKAYSIGKEERNNSECSWDSAVFEDPIEIEREVDWWVMCREVYNLNKNYIRS